MIYPENFEQKIGFDRLRGQVESLCTIEGGRRRLAGETFSSSQPQIERRLTAAGEMLGLLDELSLGDFVDLGGVLQVLRVEGSFLEPEQLVELCTALTLTHKLLALLKSRPVRTLNGRGAGVESLPEVVRHIDMIVDSHGNVRDGASPELGEIRKSIRQREGQAAKRLQQVLQAAKSAGYVDADAQLSVRDGRSVIPVAAANKRKINGFVQDESATGRTVYIEPVEVVEINNELRELAYAERREIVRILTVFTDEIRHHASRLSVVEQYLSDMDMIRAKARWARANGAVRPIVSMDGRLNLRKARHPLLEQTLKGQGKPIVPLDMELDAKRRILVISGPNAGGKSVCLKTVGVVQYMFQCGFLATVGENSELPIFESLLIDIGDEQSLDNDLSTYSSHLMNMKQMLREASPGTLILIDEFGSGTEPVIGGAIAESILERLRVKGCYGVVTTHYANLKYYASNTEGVVNGAMAFDVAQIRPLFRLEVGKPGSSFAIEIARKIGLPEDIIKDAGEKAGSEHVNIEKQLREIARDKRYWEQKRDKVRLADKKVEALEAQLETRLADVKAERSEILKRAKEEARQLVEGVNKQIENTIKVIRESNADKELTKLAREELNGFKEPPKTDKKEKKERILLAGSGTQGASALSKISAGIMNRKLNFKSNLDVRGLRVHEALDEVRDFVDDALMLGVETVSILHGTGTGALRHEIRQYLRGVREVKSAVDEHADRGGAGITIVHFR